MKVESIIEQFPSVERRLCECDIFDDLPGYRLPIVYIVMRVLVVGCIGVLSVN